MEWYIEINIRLTIPDVHGQAMKLLAYMQVLHMQNDADEMGIILRRRRSRTHMRSNLWVPA